MDIVGKVKKVPAKDLTHETWQLRKDTGLNYVTKRKEGTINRLIRESGLPMARKSDAAKMFGNSNYRNRFDAKFKDDEAWLNSQKVRFKQTRKKVGWQKMLEMPSYQKYQAKLAELQDILDRRNEIEHEVYGDRAGLDTAWIKVPGETEEPNILDRVVSKSAEAAAIMALLSTVLKMDKKKKIAKDSMKGNEMNYLKKKETLDKALNDKLYKLGVAYGKSLAKSCKAKSGMDTADVLKTIDSKKKTSLDNALNKKLYKLGHSYGKQLKKIMGDKYAQDMATTVAMDILKLNKKSAKDADNDKWRYSKNVLGMGLDPGAAITGLLADKLIKNKKPSYLKDALVEGVVGGLGRGGTQSAVGALLGLPAGPAGAALGAAAPFVVHGGASAINSLARNKIQKTFPKLSSAQAQGITSGAFGALGGGLAGGSLGALSSGSWKGALGGGALGALGGGVLAGLGGLASRWIANKLYAPMPKSELGKNKRSK